MCESSNLRHASRPSTARPNRSSIPLYDNPESMTSGFQCSGCGQWNETVMDASVGMRQSYVEDCQVCCKPNVLRIEWDRESGEYVILSWFSVKWRTGVLL